VIKNLHKPARGRNVKWAKLAVLSRPYPRAVSGTPLSYRFDHTRRSRRFVLVFRASPRIHAPTEIFVPRMQYPRGYDVRVSGPARVVSGPKAAILRLRSTGGGRVRVVVTRKR
jgi:endoglycosylceramidase